MVRTTRATTGPAAGRHFTCGIRILHGESRVFAPEVMPMNESMTRQTHDETRDPMLSDWLVLHRPALFRYCSRMTGSIADGEDAVQETMLKTVQSFPGFGALADPKAWLFRVAHNASIDILRARAKAPDGLNEELLEATADPLAASDTHWVSRTALRHFMWLTPAERSCVVLMDVLDHTLQEVAEITGKTILAVKGALHRGRKRLKEIAENKDGLEWPTLEPAEALLLDLYAQRFNARDFDGVRELLGEDVRLDLVGRTKMQGKVPVSNYVSRYCSTQDWRFVPGAVEGRPAIIVIDPDDPRAPPRYFILITILDGLIAGIRDFRYARYASEAFDWLCAFPDARRAD